MGQYTILSICGFSMDNSLHALLRFYQLTNILDQAYINDYYCSHDIITDTSISCGCYPCSNNFPYALDKNAN